MKRVRRIQIQWLESKPPKIRYVVVFLLLLAVLRSSESFISSTKNQQWNFCEKIIRNNAFGTTTTSSSSIHQQQLASTFPRDSRIVALSLGMSSDQEELHNNEEYEDDDDIINGKGGEQQHGYYDPDQLQSKIDQQQEQINQLLSMVQGQQQQQQQQQQQEQQKAEPKASSSPPTTAIPKPPVSVSSTFATTAVPNQATVATTSVSPLKAMLFIDGTWLYYSIHERELHRCPILEKYGKGWQRRYYFDWSALPRVICGALQQLDAGWAVQSRPVEIVRASVFTSYKADTSPNSYRFQMFQEMSHANYDVHMMETVGRNEKCVDINIAVEMLHYATVPNAYDVALLLTGDKDFIPALIRTRQKGRRVGLVSMRRGCNKALCEIPTDSNNNHEHNHNIRDYDVVWIDDYLDELIKPKRSGVEDLESVGDLTVFTFTKILSDYISESGMSRVSSRDIGRYLKSLTIGNQSLLDEVKIAYGGLYQFFASTSCFVMSSKTDNERNFAGRFDKSYWVGLSSDADVTMMEAAKTAKLSPLEKEFFDSYSLEPLEDKDRAYFHSRKLIGRIEASRPTPYFHEEYFQRSPSVNGNSLEGDDRGNQQELELELPEFLTQDYSHLTMPKLRDFCRENELKVSGTKAELLERIEGYVDQQTEKLQKKHDEQIATQAARVNQSDQAFPQTKELELPEFLTQDYSLLTMPKLRDFCRESELKVSGTKAELLERIQKFIDEQKEALQKDNKENHSPDAIKSASASGGAGYLPSLVLEFVKASGGKANSRELGRYLSANKASPARRALDSQSSRRTSALQELKEKHRNMNGFVYDYNDLFERQSIPPWEFEDPDDRMNKYTFYVTEASKKSSTPQGSTRQQHMEEEEDDEQDEQIEEWGYLEALIAGYIKAMGGKANSRALGKYLATNKASPERLADPTSAGDRVTALQELKERHGTMMGFVNAHKSFERREVDRDDFEDPDDIMNKYAFYVAMSDATSSETEMQYSTQVEQVQQEVS